LRAYSIDKSSAQLLALHQHNEAQAAHSVVDLLRQGARVACVSDAGTPGISDPGARLVAHVRSQGLRVLPLPGASSVTALLSAAGAVQGGESDSGFIFAGFLPSKTGERAQALDALAAQSRAFVLLEAPHRMQALAQALASLGGRTLTVGRELSKQFEEIASMRADALSDWLGADSMRLRGEFTLVVHAPDAPLEPKQDDRILRLLLAELPLKTAVKLAADISGEARNALYERALVLKQQDEGES
jgi:16S rRNA (cytidine1402-2'-O)-methyltransferase